MSLAANVVAAVKYVFTPIVELKIYYTLYNVHNLYLLLPVLSHHFGHLIGSRLVLFPSSCNPIIFRKVTKAFPCALSGYEMSSKIVA